MDGGGWQPPKALPDLRRVGIVALDTETNDDGLHADRGPAWPWRGGYICGISVAYRADGDIRALYFPIRHPDSENFDPEQVFDWLRDLIASDVRFVTQNGLYDWGWLRTEAGIKMPPADASRKSARSRPSSTRTAFATASTRCAPGAACRARMTTLLRAGIKAARLAQVSKKNPHKRTSGNCRRTMSDPTPRPMPRTRCAIRRPRSRSSIRRARAPPIGSKSICCRWCRRCASAAFASIRAPPSRRATYCCRNATPRSPSFRAARQPSAWTRSARENGWREPSTRTASNTRAPRKAIRRSPPAKSAGWPGMRTGCRG